MNTKNAINIRDLADMAARRLPKVIFDYLEGGAEDEVTSSMNRCSFSRYRFLPNVLRGNAKRDLSIKLFDDELTVPFIIGPTGLNGIFWQDADLALAKAAAETGTIFTTSTASNNSMEHISQATQAAKWFQLYPWGKREISGRLMSRAKNAGYKALVVTVDSLHPGKRERDIRNRFSHQVRLTPRVIVDGLMHPNWLFNVWLRHGMPRIENIAEFLPPNASAKELANFTRSQRNPAFCWEDVRWIKNEWNGPVLVKGILNKKDVEIAAKYGIDGIIVSNHGGRQLDGAVSTIEVLPDIVASVDGSMPILIDGGFRRGSDIVKAIALGATAVLLGRAPLYGVAAGGQKGVEKSLTILKDEIDLVLALLGCSSVKELSPEHLI